MGYAQIKNKIIGNVRQGTAFFFKIGTNPYMDWAIIFCTCVTVALVLVAFGVYIYFRVDSGVLVTVPKKKTTAAVTIDRQALKDIISYSEQKKANFEDLKKNPVGGVDPSI